MTASMFNVLKLQQSKLWTFSGVRKYNGNIRSEVINGINGQTNTSSKLNSQPNEIYKKVVVSTRQTTHSISFNVEDLTEELQLMFAERELEHIKTIVKENEIKNIRFNFIHENIYRCHLNMPIKKLGFDSIFQRYNDDKGLAIFFVNDEKEIASDHNQTGAYNRRAYTKQVQGLN